MKVLIATDGSEFSEAAIDSCGQMIECGLVTDITVISVYEAQIPIAAEPVAVSAGYYQKLTDLAHDRTVEAAKEAVARLEQFASDGRLKINHRVEMGNPASVIVETAESIGVNLIIVGSHGRGFWGRLALGSVSDAVVHKAPCSVMVVRKKL